MSKGVLLKASDVPVLKDIVRVHKRRSKSNPPQRRKRWPTGGGTAGSCDEVDEVYTYGTPTAGTFDMDYLVLASTETLTFNYNTDAADFKTELITHTKIATGDCDVFGGPFPANAIYIRWKGDLAATSIAFPSVDDSGLTGTNVSIHMRKASAYDWSGF